jgi:hypothetical protein
MAEFQFVLWVFFVLNIGLTVVYAKAKDSNGWFHLVLTILLLSALIGS